MPINYTDFRNYTQRFSVGEISNVTATLPGGSVVWQSDLAIGEKPIKVVFEGDPRYITRWDHKIDLHDALRYAFIETETDFPDGETHEEFHEAFSEELDEFLNGFRRED